MATIDKVRNRKKNEYLNINGINYGEVIAMKTYNTSIKSIIKELLRLFSFGFIIKKNGNKNSDRCLFYSLRSAKRSDYDEIVSLFLTYNPEFKLLELIQIKSFKNFHIKLGLLIKYNFHYIFNKVEDPFLSAIITTQYLMYQKQLEEHPYLKESKLLVTFCDAYPTDNLFTQIAQKKSIVTATLQHGQYRILNKGNEIADCEAYENFISDYMLTWGQATVDEFIQVGISEDRLIKAGALRKFSFNERIESNHEKKVFGVVLSGESYRETNIAMIAFANEFSIKYGFKFFLRMHPKNPAKYYLKFVDKSLLHGYSNDISNADYAKTVCFNIVHMTGVFVELLSINSPMIIYKDSLLEPIFEIESYCFENFKELNDFYQELLLNKEYLLEKQYRRYHYFNESHSQIPNNYRNALNEIMKIYDESIQFQESLNQSK